MSRHVLQDKQAIFQVLAGLMNNPEILNNTVEYSVSEQDFPERFHKIVFATIFNLYNSGIETITPNAIDSYLAEKPIQYQVFKDNSGLDYVFNLEDMGESDNFNLYYNQLKKYTFLRICMEKGIDISEFYNPSLVDVKELEAMQEKFYSMSLNDMIKHIESKMLEIKNEFLRDSMGKGSHMSENLESILQSKFESPTYGASLASNYYNAITRGARLRKVYLLSGSSGSGKSRFALANMLNICVPEVYDSKSKQWIKTGATGRCLFISTELEEDEIKIPSLCYIADVNEYKVQNGKLTAEEKKRMLRALEILKQTHFWFEELHDFDLEDIEHIISKHAIKNGVQYIAHDYIHTSMKIFSSMAKAGAKNLQEHQILLQMSIRLKELANKYNIFLSTGTQLNNNHRENESLDDSTLSGAKAIAQKVDVGAIMIPLTKKDEEAIKTVMEANNFFGMQPTHSINFYKNRGNPYKNVRLFVNFNMGTLRVTDLFVTDYKNELRTDITPLEIKALIEGDDIDEVFEQVEEIKKVEAVKTEVATETVAETVAEVKKEEAVETVVGLVVEEAPEEVIEPQAISEEMKNKAKEIAKSTSLDSMLENYQF